jgi:hypothetical protein
MSEDMDRNLVMRVQSDDEDAFEALVTGDRARLFRVWAVVADRRDALYLIGATDALGRDRSIDRPSRHARGD